MPPEQQAKPGTKAVKTIIEPGIFTAVTLDDISWKLSELLKTNNLILKELLEQADEGEVYKKEATANTATFDTIDLMGIIGHPVKGYFITNDDAANTILYGHNVTASSIDPSITTGSGRFFTLKAGESKRYTFNRRILNNIYIISVGGPAAYRIELVW